MRAIIAAVVALCTSGCAGMGVYTATFPKSGSSMTYRYAGTVLSKTKHFECVLPDGTRIVMTEPDNSPVLSAMAWGAAAKAAGNALDGAVSEAIDAIK